LSAAALALASIGLTSFFSSTASIPRDLPLSGEKNFPLKIAAEIKEWAMEHRRQLKKNWYRIKYHKPAIMI
jgi:hypothetical protein